MSLVHNERTKLTATYLNGVAIAIFAVGGFAPAIGWLNAGSTPVRRSGSSASFAFPVRSAYISLHDPS